MPVSRFVAGFLGKASFLAATTVEGGRALLGDERFVGASARWAAVGGEDVAVGEAVALMLRPEGLRLAELGSEDVLDGKVASRRFAGEATYYEVRIEGVGDALVIGDARAAHEGDRVGVTLRPGGPVPRIFPWPTEEES